MTLHHPRYDLGQKVMVHIGQTSRTGHIAAHPHQARNGGQYAIKFRDGAVAYFPADQIEALPSEPREAVA